ncbi:hypothetical protein AAVH_29721 [Aphelenchoides avenae]|nr:hypothetical protein AAVH_29721 [Aphelenchus avenae]
MPGVCGGMVPNARIGHGLIKKPSIAKVIAMEEREAKKRRAEHARETKKRRRDEKATDTEETSSSGATDQLAALEKAFLVKHPQSLLDFWGWAKTLSAKKPKGAFEELGGLQLVGSFDLLDGSLADVADDLKLVHFRYSSDLPEMQTIMVWNGGRYCYWRDDPTAEKPYLIHVPTAEEHFAKLEIVGKSDPFQALFHLSKQLKKPIAEWRHLFPKEFDFAAAEKAAAAAKKARKSETVGEPLHGIGIQVPMKDELGYRPVCEKKSQLRKDMIEMATTKSEEVKQAKRDQIMKLYTHVQFANDEMDFGMGLEFGQDLFHSNYDTFEKLAHNVLKTGYQLLGRKPFVEILEAQSKQGRFREEVSVLEA